MSKFTQRLQGFLSDILGSHPLNLTRINFAIARDFALREQGIGKVKGRKDDSSWIDLKKIVSMLDAAGIKVSVKTCVEGVRELISQRDETITKYDWFRKTVTVSSVGPLTDEEATSCEKAYLDARKTGTWLEGVQGFVTMYEKLRPRTDPTAAALIQTVHETDPGELTPNMHEALRRFNAAHPHGVVRPMVGKADVERLREGAWKLLDAGMRDHGAMDYVVEYIANELGCEVES